MQVKQRHRVHGSEGKGGIGGDVPEEDDRREELLQEIHGSYLRYVSRPESE